MKNPHKYSWLPLKASSVSGIVLIASLFPTTTLSDDPSKITLLVTIYLVFLLIGLTFSTASGTIFHRRVLNPVVPKKLVVNQIYWLNGETWARFVSGPDDWSDMYLFSVWGIGRFDDPDDVVALTPARVKKYVSNVQEVFGKTRR